MDKSLPHIVIVGGGAGGLELAVQLGKKLGKNHLANITLVDQNLTHLWKPLLHEVAAGTLNSQEDELNYLVLGYQHHFNFEPGLLVGLDRQNKTIRLQSIKIKNQPSDQSEHELHYDILVLAIGSLTNDFHIEGVREHCYFLDSSEQAEKIHDECLSYFIKSQHEKVDAKLAIAIVGAGATGIELAAELYFALKNYTQYSLRNKQLAKNLQITLIESGSRLLPMLPDYLTKNISNQFEKMGIKILLNETVAKVTADGIYTKDEKFIPAQIKIWTAGIKGQDLVKELDYLQLNNRQQIMVKNTLQTTVDDSIFAMGDCAACSFPGSDKTVPPRAQAAHQQAKLLARSLPRLICGKDLLEFHYQDFGSLVTISRYNTVGQLMAHRGINIGLEGFFARWIYIGLYKRHQIAVLGFWRTCLLTIANFLVRPAKSFLKLH